jgi:hypothetical protein
MEKFCPALCGTALAKSLQSNISANSKQKLKIFYGVNRGPMGNRLAKKTEGKKSHDTVPLSKTERQQNLLDWSRERGSREKFWGRERPQRGRDFS